MRTIQYRAYAFYFIFIALGMALLSKPVFSREIIKDINAILQVEDEIPQKEQEVLVKKQKSEEKKKKMVQKRIISRYSEENPPRTRDFVDAFKIAVEITFGMSKENDQIEEIRSAAYILKGTGAFVVQGLEYCMFSKYLGKQAEETKESYLEKNSITLKNAELVFSKTKPMLQKENEQLTHFVQENVEKEFSTVESCAKHEYNTKEGLFTLSTYPPTREYVDIVNTFLRTQ